MYLWMGEWKIRSESLRGSKLFLNFIPKELDHFYYKPIKVIPREIYQNEWWITCGLWRQTRPFQVGADTPLCLPQPTEGGPPSTGGWFPSPNYLANRLVGAHVRSRGVSHLLSSRFDLHFSCHLQILLYLLCKYIKRIKAMTHWRTTSILWSSWPLIFQYKLAATK